MKVSLFLCLINLNAMKTYGKMEIQLHASLTSSLDRGSIIPGEREPLYPLDRRLDGTQSWNRRGGEKKALCPCQESNTSRSICSLIHYTDCDVA